MTSLNTATDLSGGIPVAVWGQANQPARDLLLREHQRQRAEAARQREAGDAERQDALRRYLARPSGALAPAAQMRRLQQLLTEAAAVAGALATAMPATGTATDAPASPTQEHPQ